MISTGPAVRSFLTTD